MGFAKSPEPFAAVLDRPSRRILTGKNHSRCRGSEQENETNEGDEHGDASTGK